MRVFKVIFILVMLLSFCVGEFFVRADCIGNDNNIVSLRAGGGSGGSSSGGGGGSSHGGGRIPGSGSGFYCNHHNVILCILDYIPMILLYVIMFFWGMIILYLKVIRSSINSKRYMKMISDKDIAWKYKNIEKQVIETFYIVQDAWTKMDIDLAKEYMDDNLYESFGQKLVWMEIGKKRNILKRIKLRNLKPVSVYNDMDDSKDLIWFYIKGSMVDYMINTDTLEIIDGKNGIIGSTFVEFWMFVRKGDKWVLSKILQEDEKDQIIFQ